MYYLEQLLLLSFNISPPSLVFALQRNVVQRFNFLDIIYKLLGMEA